MPKNRPLTQREREAQATENEIQRATAEFLRAVGLKRGLESKTYIQVAEDIGVSRVTLLSWRNGKLRDASFGRVVAASRKLGYRLVFEPIAGSGR